MALIEMGDFAGAVIKYIRHHTVAKLSICGGFGKISKLAAGHMDLNSRASSIDFAQLAQWAKERGADDALQHKVRKSNTSIEAMELCCDQHIDLGNKICQQALTVVRARLPAATEVELFTVDRRGTFVGYAGDGLSPLSQTN